MIFGAVNEYLLCFQQLGFFKRKYNKLAKDEEENDDDDNDNDNLNDNAAEE